MFSPAHTEAIPFTTEVRMPSVFVEKEEKGQVLKRQGKGTDWITELSNSRAVDHPLKTLLRSGDIIWRIRRLTSRIDALSLGQEECLHRLPEPESSGTH